MVITAFSFGIGSLLIGLVIKSTPQEWIDKMPELINENSKEG